MFRCSWVSRSAKVDTALCSSASLTENISVLETPLSPALIKACWSDGQVQSFLIAEPTRAHRIAIERSASELLTGEWVRLECEPDVASLRNRHGWWKLTLSPDRLELSIGRREFLPVYTSHSRGVVYLDWNPMRLPGVLSSQEQWRTREMVGEAFSLATLGSSAPPGSKRIPVGSTMQSSGHAVFTTVQDTSFATFPAKGTYRKDPVALFGQVLQDEVAAYLPETGTPSVEVSGGVDSTLVAAALTALGRAWRPVTKRMPGALAAPQRARVTSVCAPADVEPQIVETGHLGAVDWDGTADGRSRLPFHSDPYGLLSLKEYAVAGPGLLFTGHGGDELFFPSEGSLARRHERQERRHLLLGLLGIDASEFKVQQRGLSRLAVAPSVNAAMSSRSFLMNVSRVVACAPLGSPVLRRMTSLLPRHAIEDKSIAVEWLYRVGYDGSELRHGSADSLAGYLSAGAGAALTDLVAGRNLFYRVLGWNIEAVSGILEVAAARQDPAATADLGFLFSLRRIYGHLQDRCE